MAAKKKNTGKLQIIVGHRGWVHVGRVVSESASEVVVEGARCVRRWGTLKGLAFLGGAGPQKEGGRETLLDAPGTLRIHPLAIMHRYDCDEAAWRGKL